LATRHRFLVAGREHTVVVDEVGGGVVVTVDDGEPLTLDVAGSGVPGTLSLLIDGQPRSAYVTRRGAGFEVIVEGRRFAVGLASAGRQRGAIGAKDRPGEITAPLAGVVVELRVAVGDVVTAGQTLLVIEAMKMQNEIQAPQAGTITAIHFEVGQRAEQGARIVDYTPAE
jgi:biotin carboxyl carrier protein